MTFRASDFLSRRRNIRRAGAEGTENYNKEDVENEVQVTSETSEETADTGKNFEEERKDETMEREYSTNTTAAQNSHSNYISRSESSAENASVSKKEEYRPLTAEDVRGIVSHELNMASVKTQMLEYFDDIAASSNRTESMISDMRRAIDESLGKISEVASKNVDPEKLEQIDEAVRSVAKMSENLEGTLHKDNLISYQNTKSVLDDMNKKIDNINKKNNSIDARVAQTDNTVKDSIGKIRVVVLGAAALSALSFIGTIINLICSLAG